MNAFATSYVDQDRDQKMLEQRSRPAMSEQGVGSELRRSCRNLSAPRIRAEALRHLRAEEESDESDAQTRNLSCCWRSEGLSQPRPKTIQISRPSSLPPFASDAHLLLATALGGKWLYEVVVNA